MTVGGLTPASALIAELIRNYWVFGFDRRSVGIALQRLTTVAI